MISWRSKWVAPLIACITEKRVIEIFYKSEPQTRILFPACVGVIITDQNAYEEMVNAYQVGGYSTSFNIGWKFFNLADIGELIEIDNFFTLGGYNVHPNFDNVFMAYDPTTPPAGKEKKIK
jgi:hypothetical protein